MNEPVPICKIARENGGRVPLDCLFGCDLGCAEEHATQREEEKRQRDERAALEGLDE